MLREGCQYATMEGVAIAGKWLRMATEPTTVQAGATDEVLQAPPEEIAASNAVMGKLGAAAQETVRLLDSIHRLCNLPSPMWEQRAKR